MMTYIAIIVLSFIAGAAFARRFLDLRLPAAAHQPAYFDAAAGSRALGAVSRVFEAGDQRYVNLAGMGLRSRFRRERCYAMRLFLRQTRLEFNAIMREASEAAKDETPEFGAELAALSFRFNRLYWGLWLRTQFSCFLFKPIPRAMTLELVGIARGLTTAPALASHSTRV